MLHLLFGPHSVVTLVFIGQTQVTDTLVVAAAEHFQQLVVNGTDRLLQLFAGSHQFVLLESSRLVVRLDVEVAVRGQTNQTRFDCLVLSPRAHVAFDIVCLGETLDDVAIESNGLESLNHVSQHGVPGQSWPRVKVLTALRAGEDAQDVVLVPVLPNAVEAVVVSTRDSDRVLERVQTYGTVELVLVQNYTGLSHCPKEE